MHGKKLVEWSTLDDIILLANSIQVDGKEGFTSILNDSGWLSCTFRTAKGADFSTPETSGTMRLRFMRLSRSNPVKNLVSP